jgi:hypothetical protein
VVVVLSLSNDASAATEDEKFLTGLRERRLFKTAQAYCEEKLARLKLNETERATLTIESMLTLSQQAAYAPPGEREPLWQAARGLAAKFPVDHPRKLVIDLQAALVVLAQGELARQEAEAGAAPDFAGAQTLLREASKELDDLERKLAKQIAIKPTTPDALTADELFALQHNVRYQLARARRNQALCYPAGSDDRVAALGQALDQLGKLQTQLAADEPLMWRLKIDQGICQRLREDYTSATRTLTGLITGETPLNVQLHARAELARVALASGAPDEAQRVLQAGRSSVEMLSAELEYAQLETYVALWQRADGRQDTQNAGRFRQQAVDQLAALERQFGSYWSRRGERLVIGSAGAGDENVDILARSADARFVKGEFDEQTLAAYDKAATSALASDNLKRYLELAYRAAIVEQKRKNVADAAARLMQLGEKIAEHPKTTDDLQAKAAAAHWQGLRWLQSLKDSDAARQSQLATSYERHGQLWPKQNTSGAALMALADLQQRDEKWDAAIATLKKLPADHLLAGEASLLAARLTLQHTTDGHAAAEELLKAALDQLPMCASESRDAAEALLVVALAGQPSKRGDAEKMIAQLGTDSPQRLLEMLDGLAKLSPGEAARRDLANVQLRAIELLEPQTSKLSAEQRSALARLQAEALFASGQRDKALALYEQLAKDQATSAAIQEGYASALAASNQATDWTKALGQWRVIAQRSRPQTDRWYRAKYEVALLNFRLGDKGQAAQLIKYLKATPPGLEGTALERKFEDLLRQCER